MTQKQGVAAGPPKPPDDEPPPDRQISLTDPDSRLAGSDAHEVRQAYNAQAVVCAKGSQLIVTADVAATSAEASSFKKLL
ncbi:transposase [Komagataeibacter medellinensis NBRC 3288]|uniref:Transposase n=1 Tax=Komagataeibacter medellinensis (strain NBRC 3288 / BCRC 11682 / LMG 1693 / Kondo 51) TaxID=634177 RepID=G2I739_KOMMN|nr:transposase [Komagataeibacter medellinensis NBRC 3288]